MGHITFKYITQSEFIIISEHTTKAFIHTLFMFLFFFSFLKKHFKNIFFSFQFVYYLNIVRIGIINFRH